MASNKGTTLKIKNNAGSYNALYPSTTKEQVVAWNIGEVNGPFILLLKADGWSQNKQTLPLEGVSVDDILNCTKVLTGTKEQMAAQIEAYDNLNHIKGIQSANNAVVFTCDKVPEVDIQVQVWWTK